MDARLNLYDSTMAAKFAKYINSSAPPRRIRPCRRRPGAGEDPGQPDQRVFGLPRHAHKDAEHSGEASVPLHPVAAWREATVFTEAEKARRAHRARDAPRGRCRSIR